jgi:hypothetical protein
MVLGLENPSLICRATPEPIAPHIHVLYRDVPFILNIKKAAPGFGAA